MLTSTQEEEATYLIKYALCCNGYSVNYYNATWTDELEGIIETFQSDYALPRTGRGDLDTWMSLLLSKGNTDRAALGCDCATILTATKAGKLYDAGYRYVGRYLTGNVNVNGSLISKALTISELNIIFDAGLKVFAIYQSGVPSVNYFSYEQGQLDATFALNAAVSLGIPYHEKIYFAVDYDMTKPQITTNVLPYFRGIRNIINNNNNKYSIGIYGARNVCTRVCSAHLASSSFVADMSTGYSGNMGFPIPKNWAFDQFYEISSFISPDGNFAIDKDAYSRRYSGFNILVNHDSDLDNITPTD